MKVCEEGNDGTNWMKPTSNKCDRGRGGGGLPIANENEGERESKK